MGLAQAVNGRLRQVPVWPIYATAFTYAAWLFWLGVSGGLGVDPVKGLEWAVGKTGLQLLIAGLLVTPLRKTTGVSLIKFRRALGLSAFFFILLHLLVWLVLDIQLRWGEIWADILKRPYITIGMTGFLVLIPLAITSNNRSVRRLGAAAWGRLHRLTYLAVAAGAIHYLMVVKAWPLEPVLYCVGVGALLLLRVRFRALLVAGSGPANPETHAAAQHLAASPARRLWSTLR